MTDTQIIAPPEMVRFFSEISIDQVPLVGGKNASLGEMYSELASKGVRVPNGFAITAPAYRYAIEAAGVGGELHELLDPLEPSDVTDLQTRAAAARDIVYRAGLPDDLEREILVGYAALRAEYGDDVTLAVRSSATAEDLPEASFAGAHETYLNISGDEPLLDAVRRCYASLYTDRGMHYRLEQGFGQFDVAQSVGVMKMVRSDLSSSGVIFTLDTQSGFRDVVYITGAYGLGENVVQGAVDPDEFYVFKQTLNAGYETVLRRSLGAKALRLVYDDTNSASPTRNDPVDASDAAKYCVSDDEVITLAKAAIVIEDHYSVKADESRPMDLEWAKDGVDGELCIVQARPETVASQHAVNELEIFHLEGESTVLVTRPQRPSDNRCSVALWHSSGGQSSLVDMPVCWGTTHVQSAPRDAGRPIDT